MVLDANNEPVVMIVSAEYNGFSAGTYFWSDTVRVVSLTYGSLKKLDPKYLPEGGVGYEGVTDIGDTLTWDGTPTDVFVGGDGVYFYKISDDTPR